MSTALTVPRVTTTAEPPRRRNRVTLSFVATHAVGIALGAMFLLPFVFIVLTAFMSDNQALTANLWPTSWHPGNFAEVFRKAPLLTYVANSLLYAGLATLFMLMSSVPAAYALSRYEFRYRNGLFLAVIAMMVLPPQVTQVPIYVMWAKLGFTGTLWPLILPNLLGDAFSIFLLRQFLLTIPKEYTEAARVDGCGEVRTLLTVVLPMIRPAIAAVALFQFFYCWNDYFGPQIYTSENPGAWTLSYGLQTFKSAHHTNWNLTMAATLLVMAPVILLFFLAQRAFIEGVTLTGVKG